MRILLFLLVLTSSFAFGQSAKKINKQLRMQIELEAQKQESSFLIYDRKGKEFDSMRTVFDKKVRLLSQNEQAIKMRLMNLNELMAQLNQLGVNPNSIEESFDLKTNMPSHKELIEPIEGILKVNIGFNRVRLYHNPDLEHLARKEQNRILTEKIKEYQFYEKTNSLHQQDAETRIRKLVDFSPKLDSLALVYKAIDLELRKTGGKLRDKLDELRGNYIEKGPHGFPEAYKKVFYDAFPPSQDETREEASLHDSHKEGMKLDEVGPVAVEPESVAYEIVDEYAVFPGGYEASKVFVAKNLRYPEKFKELAVEGRISLSFIVSDKGGISNIQVDRGLQGCKECDDEAIRLVKSMPNWIPARVNGRAVYSKTKFIVRFKLQE